MFVNMFCKFANIVGRSKKFTFLVMLLKNKLTLRNNDIYMYVSIIKPTKNFCTIWDPQQVFL